MISYIIANYNAKKLKKNFNYILINQKNLVENKYLVLSKIKNFLINKNIKYIKYNVHHIAGGNRVKKKFI